MSKPVSLYFLHAQGRIKIGISNDVARRLSDLRHQNGSSLSLLGSMPGSLQLERYIHGLLAAHRLHGEWFTDCDQVRAVMTTALTRGADAIGFVPPVPKKPLKMSAKAPHHIMLARLCDLMWPHEALRRLAAFAEQPEEVCARWMAGEVEMPRLIRMAFAREVHLWMDREDRGVETA